MPANPFRRACSVAGCSQAPTFRGRCAVHARQVDGARAIGTDRQVGRSLYSTLEWRTLRAALLALHPFCECEVCVSGPRREYADHVHHIRPHGGDRRLFFARENLMLLSAACHARLHAPGGVNFLRKHDPAKTAPACCDGAAGFQQGDPMTRGGS